MINYINIFLSNDTEIELNRREHRIGVEDYPNSLIFRRSLSGSVTFMASGENLIRLHDAINAHLISKGLLR